MQGARIVTKPDTKAKNNNINMRLKLYSEVFD